MGYWKNKMMEQEDAYNSARDFLCEVGCLEECENGHATYFSGSEDIQTAYKIANARITSGQITLSNGETRRNYTDLLKAVYEDNSFLSECPVCEKNFGPD